MLAPAIPANENRFRELEGEEAKNEIGKLFAQVASFLARGNNASIIAHLPDQYRYGPTQMHMLFQVIKYCSQTILSTTRPAVT